MNAIRRRDPAFFSAWARDSIKVVVVIVLVVLVLFLNSRPSQCQWHVRLLRRFEAGQFPFFLDLLLNARGGRPLSAGQTLLPALSRGERVPDSSATAINGKEVGGRTRPLPGRVGFILGEGGKGGAGGEPGRTFGLVDAFQICSRITSSQRI